MRKKVNRLFIIIVTLTLLGFIYPKKNKLSTIEYESFERLKDKGDSQWVLVGSKHCSVCREIYPIVVDYFNEIGTEISYMDVAEGNHSMILEDYNINDLPKILEIKGNQFNQYSIDELIDKQGE